MVDNIKPTRCIDPIMKHCQGCEYGHCMYPDSIENIEDLEGCSFEVSCIYGFDKGRPEDKPTEEEWKEFDEWYRRTYGGSTFE